MPTQSEIKQAVVDVERYFGIDGNIKNLNGIKVLMDLAQSYLSASKIVERKEINNKGECATCQHKPDSGNEYCGCCDSITNNYTPNDEIVHNEGWNACHSAFTLAIMKRVDGIDEVIYKADELCETCSDIRLDRVRNIAKALTQHLLSKEKR